MFLSFLFTSFLKFSFSGVQGVPVLSQPAFFCRKTLRHPVAFSSILDEQENAQEINEDKNEARKNDPIFGTFLENTEIWSLHRVAQKQNITDSDAYRAKQTSFVANVFRYET